GHAPSHAAWPRGVKHASAPRKVRRYSAWASPLVVRIELPVPAAAGILLEVVVGVAPEPLHMVVHEDEIAAALVHACPFAPCEDADGVVGTVREQVHPSVNRTVSAGRRTSATEPVMPVNSGSLPVKLK